VEIVVYVLNKLKRSSILFKEKIRKLKNIPERFLINFPSHLSCELEEFGFGNLTTDEFWEIYKEKCNVNEPFLNALKYKYNPILESLPDLYEKLPDLQIMPYQNLSYIEKVSELEEEILLETFRARLTGKIKVEEWKELLSDDYEWNATFREKNEETILNNIDKDKNYLILYEGYVKSLLQKMRAMGYFPRINFLKEYYRSPLEMFIYEIGKNGSENISDECIKKCIKDHIRYVELILYEKSIDDAHKKWENSTNK